jgi:hypothetical protein
LLLCAACADCSVVVLAARAVSGRIARREVSLDQPARGDTRQPDQRRSPRCAGHEERSGSDQAWVFRATNDGRHVARVRALHDATVSVYDGDRELACDDDGAAVGEPRVEFEARAGHTYSIVVDGYRAERGPYELTLSR